MVRDLNGDEGLWDEALAASLVVWSRAREAAGDTVAQLFHEHDENGDGVMTWMEFSSFTEACQPGLPTRQKKELFRKAMNNKGSSETAAATPASVKSVAMTHGLGFLPVYLPLDPLVPHGAPQPPIDEFALLEEAWAAAEERTKTALDAKKARAVGCMSCHVPFTRDALQSAGIDSVMLWLCFSSSSSTIPPISDCEVKIINARKPFSLQRRSDGRE